MKSIDACYLDFVHFGQRINSTLQIPGTPRLTLLDQDRIPIPYTVSKEGLVSFKLYYPNASSVKIKTLLFAFELYEEQKGFWVGTFKFDATFTSIWVFVDNNPVLSPYLPIGFGDNRPMNYIDIPDARSLRTPTMVPHGTITQDFIVNSVTGQLERVFVYVPAGYFTDDLHNLPVLYLQHGFGENETVWLSQAKINFVLDELIAQNKIAPMLVVMCNGMLLEWNQTQTLTRYDEFDQYLIHDVLPHIEKQYRVNKRMDHRAIAGLSMGSIQTSRTVMGDSSLFGYIGLFSGFLSDPLTQNDKYLNHVSIDKFKLSRPYLFRAMGDMDEFLDVFLKDDLIIEKYGIECIRKIYPGRHEWDVWRQCFYDFIQVIFK